MLIGVVSDTHGDVARTRQAVVMLESLEVEVVLHCGDIGSSEVVELFQNWPTHFIFGNCDHDRAALRRSIRAAGQTCHERFAEIELDGIKIALAHGDDPAALEGAIQGGQFGLVCTGHTHIARVQWHGPTLVLNPGAVHRANPHSIATVTLPEREAMVVTI